MITTKEVKIKKVENLNSNYVESQLKEMGFDVLRWAITETDDNFNTLNIAIVENL